MSKKNKKNKIENKQVTIASAPAAPSEPKIKVDSPWEINYKEETKNLTLELNEKEAALKETSDFLNSNHNLYESIKENASNIQKNIFDGEEAAKAKEVKSEFLFIDFENNNYYDGLLHQMPTVYYDKNKEYSHVCKKEGIYIDKEFYTASKLFLSKKKEVSGSIKYLNSFKEVIDELITSHEIDNNFSYFCMLPEAVDIFNTQLRSCLNTHKGKIISIPKSVAVCHQLLDSLPFNTRICVVDLDGLNPIITSLLIGKDEEGQKIIQREGFLRKQKINYSYKTFAQEYLTEYAYDHNLDLTENEKDLLIANKQLNRVFIKKKPFTIFRENERININFDEELFNDILAKYQVKNFDIDRANLILVISSVPNIIAGEKVQQTDNQIALLGLEKIRNILLKNKDAIIWKEMLPKISLEVIDETTHRFKTIELIDNTKGQNINLSLDEELEISSPGTITFQKGYNEYYLPLEREIYEEDINSEKEAYFKDKSFPLDKDVKVKIIVKYNYMSESPIKLYATPISANAPFKAFANEWRDPHKIEKYGKTIYKGHKNPMQDIFDTVFEKAINSMRTVISGSVYEMVNSVTTNNQNDVAPGFLNISNAYGRIRSIFDSNNIKEPEFLRNLNVCQITKYMDFVNKILNLPKDRFGQKLSSKLLDYKKQIRIITSNIVVACRYAMPKNSNVRDVYEEIAENNKTGNLSKLSRCIKCKADDEFAVFEKLANKLYTHFTVVKKNEKKDKKVRDLRNLSSNCWFQPNWINQFYHTEKGPELVNIIIQFYIDYFESKKYLSGKYKEYRDLMEFLACLTRLRDINENLFNPNDPKTKKLLSLIKSTFENARRHYPKDMLVSRLAIKQDQGPLKGYPNYIYMLIVVLSGEGQIDLLSYKDE